MRSVLWPAEPLYTKALLPDGFSGATMPFAIVSPLTKLIVEVGEFVVRNGVGDTKPLGLAGDSEVADHGLRGRWHTPVPGNSEAS